MKPVPHDLIDSMVRACREVAGHNLVRCSSGNLSMRVDSERLLIKASRSWMARAEPDDISLCAMADSSLLAGRKPSVEIGFHAGVLRTRPDVNVVLHFQSPFATTLACQAPEPVNFFVIPEIPFYVGPVARIPYSPPGSPDLAQAVTQAMQAHDMVLLGNHGQVTAARDWDHAIQNALFFELACEIILRSANRALPIPQQEVQALLSARQTALAKV